MHWRKACGHQSPDSHSRDARPIFHARLEDEIYSRSLDDAAFHKHLRRKALRVFTDGLSSPNPSQRMWAAKEVLARIPADPEEEEAALNRSIFESVMATERP